MTYSLINNRTKNYYNRMLTLQVIVEDIVTWIFLKHSVDCVLEKSKPQTLNRNAKSQRILTKLHALDSEYIAIRAT